MKLSAPRCRVGITDECLSFRPPSSVTQKMSIENGRTVLHDTLRNGLKSTFNCFDFENEKLVSEKIAFHPERLNWMRCNFKTKCIFLLCLLQVVVAVLNWCELSSFYVHAFSLKINLKTTPNTMNHGINFIDLTPRAIEFTKNETVTTQSTQEGCGPTCVVPLVVVPCGLILVFCVLPVSAYMLHRTFTDSDGSCCLFKVLSMLDGRRKNPIRSQLADTSSDNALSSRTGNEQPVSQQDVQHKTATQGYEQDAPASNDVVHYNSQTFNAYIPSI